MTSQTVDNNDLTDFKVRATANAASEQIQHVRIDVGSGATESQVESGTPLPVSASTLPLPSGAATAANQTTGNSSLSTIAGDTTSIDGKITACDTGSIAGTVTANAGTNLNTSALATESGGNLDTIAGDTTSLDGKVTACDTTNLASGLVQEAHDYIALSYTGANLTGVVYKSGGAGGSTVGTLTLAYTGSQLDSVTRT